MVEKRRNRGTDFKSNENDHLNQEAVRFCELKRISPLYEYYKKRRRRTSIGGALKLLD